MGVKNLEILIFYSFSMTQCTGVLTEVENIQLSKVTVVDAVQNSYCITSASASIPK